MAPSTPVAAVALEHLLQRLLAHVAGAHLALEVALHRVAQAHVQQDDLPHVPVVHPAPVELGRRYPETFLPDRGGMRVPSRGSTAADVRVVAPAEDPEAQFPTEEHRLDHRDVRRVVVAAVGIVEDHHVPGLHVVPEMIADGLDREGARSHQHGDIRGLGNEPEPVVEHRGDEVLVLGEDGGAGAAQHAGRPSRGSRLQDGW